LDGRFMPIMIDQPVAPPEILDVIWSSCKKDCSTKRCTCKIHGLPCTVTCGECRAAHTHSCLIYLIFEYDPEGKNLAKNKPGTDRGCQNKEPQRRGWLRIQAGLKKKIKRKTKNHPLFATLLGRLVCPRDL